MAFDGLDFLREHVGLLARDGAGAMERGDEQHGRHGRKEKERPPEPDGHNHLSR
jgi:hypothetical protein